MKTELARLEREIAIKIQENQLKQNEQEDLKPLEPLTGMTETERPEAKVVSMGITATAEERQAIKIVNGIACDTEGQAAKPILKQRNKLSI